ncbi:MAG TPA: hypothetical protein VNZ52_11925 [Candidatus Thermoplasmatota archaeon]|nr:hypothetical protein [Candidatus Thermoplasmatota archaeon]
MHPKLAQIQGFIERGYECADIRSDSGRIDVFLTRGGVQATILSINKSEAWEILQAPTPKRERGARYLVKGPVR